MISTESAIEIVKRKSRKNGGRGTMIMASIMMTNTTTARSLDWVKTRRLDMMDCKKLAFFLAIDPHSRKSRA